MLNLENILFKLRTLDKAYEKLIEFLKKDPYSKLKPIAKYDISDLIIALNWAAANEILEAFYELGLDKTLTRSRSTMEVAFEHYIVDIDFLKEILNSLVKLGILDEAAGRFKIRFFKRKIKRPGIVDVFSKTPLRAVFEIIKLMGESIVDQLLTGKSELDWIKDAAIAFEPLEFSPQMIKLRLMACDFAYRYILNVLNVENKKEPLILVTGLASGFGIVNVAQYFKDTNAIIVALDPSEREVNLARDLLEEFNLSVDIETYNILKNPAKAPHVRKIINDMGRFSLAMTFERWRFFDDVQRAQILTNIAYCLETYGSLIDLSLTKNQAMIFNTLLYTIRGWKGYLDINEKRRLFGLVFQRLKERNNKIIVRADMPLTRGIWL